MKFTIVTICYNCERFVAQTIESVLLQNYQEFEYLFVDGGSTDGTLPIIKRYAGSDSRFRWISEQDDGLSDAMNKGISMAEGDIVAHLHADDFYPVPTVLSTVAEKFLHNTDALWLTGGVYLVNRHGEKLREIKVRNYSYRRLVRGNCILHPATFVRKKAFEKVGGFDISLRYAMDYDLWLRLGALADPIRVDAPLACFRVHDGSLSMTRADDVCDEEFHIRKRVLDNGSLGYYFHYLNFLFKKRMNRYVVRNISVAARR